MLRLYGFPPTRSLRALWTLRELELPFEYVNVDLSKRGNQEDAFLRVNPAGKVPALVDGDFVVTESVAIVLYLADKYRDKSLLPTDLEGRATANRWLMFVATELEQPLWRIAHHTTLYPKDRRLPEEITLAREDFRKMAAVFDAHMKGRAFVVGDTFTVADIVAAYTLDWANEVKLLETFPNLRTWMERMYERSTASPRIKDAIASVRSAAPSGSN